MAAWSMKGGPISSPTPLTLSSCRARIGRFGEKVYRQFYASFTGHINTIAATYGTSVKKRRFYAQARRYESALTAALFSDNVPKSVYTDLISAVHEHLPTMYRYVQIRKQILGLEQPEMFDIYAPLVSRKWT